MARRKPKESVDVTTTAFTSVDGGVTMAHVVREGVDEKGNTVLEVVGIGSSVVVDPFTTGARAVAHYVRTKIAKMTATAYANRKVTPILKESGKRRRAAAGSVTIPEGKALCWRCGNRPGDVEGCPTCWGEGLVEAGTDPLGSSLEDDDGALG